MRKRLRDSIDDTASGPPGHGDHSVRGGVRQRLNGAAALSSSSASSNSATVGRQGGVKQRLQTSGLPLPTESCATTSALPFNAALKRDWSSGKISSATVVEYAKKAAQQGAESADVLASDHANAHRHLVDAIGYPDSAPDIDWIEIPNKDGSLVAHPIICPLNWFEKIVANYPERFKKVVKGPDGDLEEFWRHLSEHVIWTSNVDRLDRESSIPCTIHGDGAPTNKVESLFTISWSSLLGEGPTKSTRHIFTVVQKGEMGAATLAALFRRLAWSFNALALGRMPRKDWNGKRTLGSHRVLANGWRLAAIGLRGDWEFFCQVCGFPTSTNVPHMCFMCKASPTGPLCWSRGDAEAPWRATMKSHESYLAELAAEHKQVPAVFAIRTLRLEGVIADAMHTIDLGVAAHLCGNVMHEVMETAGWGPTQADRAKVLSQELQAYYKRTREKHKLDGKLTYHRIKKSGDWPKFLGKAAHTRRLVYFCLELATRFDSGSEHDRMRRAAAIALAQILDIMDSEPRFLSAAARDKLVRLSKAFIGVWTKLSINSLARHERGWKMTPKFHLMQHILEHQSWINPRYTWVYADEDLQRILKAVALSCHVRNTPHMVLFKWAVHTFDS